ncbi:MAG: TIGR01777 family oxidoreductase [Balneola sp.]|nr:TIGR01777 family oxidoreductase [Balneola sp.]MBO6651693.1 TIGR01777 family oxidoreductase [Balneola sp.]MBO6712869.1 TIGR01777 family oxidoreductase [Balneola sp.]MBO6801168.1 TIGR01777 family oxidoreductase [Balneola sp.]MBO6871360.1 TIGR01777 family oxidoreductase [Balneola sp.]
MNFLITGGTGFIGQELREKLLRKGNNLVIITRSPKKYEDESASNQSFISWDDDLVKVMDNTDVVINLAGENIFGQRWNEDVKKRIYDSRIDSTRSLVEAMEKAENKPSVFISASASGIYGDQGDSILTEEQKAADDFLANVCVDWEKESQKAKEFGVRVVNPRIGIVFEDGGGALEKMIPPFRFFVGGPIGDGKQYMSWIHRSDLVNALIFPVEKEELVGAYNVCSPNPATMNEVAATLGDVMNRPSFFRVPKFALELAFGEAAQPITGSIRMQPKQLQVHGFEFRYEELEEALADILA